MNRRDFIYAASVGAASATMPTATVAQGNRDTSGTPHGRLKLRTITLEEHFAIAVRRIRLLARRGSRASSR
jgi:hypothetical protein